MKERRREKILIALGSMKIIIIIIIINYGKMITKGN